MNRFYSAIRASRRQRSDDILSLVGYGKYTLSALGFKRNALVFKEVLGVLCVKAVERAVKKAGIGRNVRKKFLR